jgi:NADH dehydrogenase, FAD-containing subunit
MGCKWRATITSWSLNRQRSGCVMRRMWSSSAIDKRNLNLFQPQLYQVATGLVSRSDVATPLREVVGKQHNVQVLDAEDAQLPIASGKGPSIAEPDAALKAAIDYYAPQLSDLPQTQELLDTKEASVADSDAAIR